LQYDSKQCATVKCFDNIEEGIKNCDVVMVLRLQKERMLEADIPNEQEYCEHPFHSHCLNRYSPRFHLANRLT
jgi:aspartate carbamoyltransferase catalytic subunit